MHADTADHTFILVDTTGHVRFHEDYPTMWVDPSSFLDETLTVIGEPLDQAAIVAAIDEAGCEVAA